MRILALDLARLLGWARADGLGAPSAGTFRLAWTGRDHAAFLGEYRYWLNGQITAFEPRLIGFESPILKPTDHLEAIRKLYGLASMTEVVAMDRCIPVVERSVRAVRSAFLGKDYLKQFKGRDEQKRAVIAECRSRGWEPKDDNEADAMGLLDLLRTEYVPSFPTRAQARLAALRAAA